MGPDRDLICVILAKQSPESELEDKVTGPHGATLPRCAFIFGYTNTIIDIKATTNFRHDFK